MFRIRVELFLAFTHKWTNPKFGPVSGDFESGISSGNFKRFSLKSGYLFPQLTFEFAVEPKWRMSDAVTVVVSRCLLMAVAGCAHSVTGLGNL